MSTAEAERTQEWIPEIERSDVAVRLPVSQQFVRDLEISGSQWRVLTDQIFPAAKTVQAIAMALTYCRARKLDIFKRPVHIVPMYSSALKKMVETVWPGISELRTTAARTTEYAGIDEVQYGPTKKRTFKGTTKQWVQEDGGGRKEKDVQTEKTIEYPEWASVVIYRFVKGQRCAFHTKVFWLEAYATMGKSDLPNEMWESRPFGQLDKCVEAAALRKAFPEEIGNDYAAEEMHGRELPPDVAAAAVPERARPPKPEASKPEPAKPTQTEAAKTEPAKPKAEPKPKVEPKSEGKPATDFADTRGDQREHQQSSNGGFWPDRNDSAEDADFEPMDDDPSVEQQAGVEEAKPLDTNAMLQALDDELKDANDEATVEEVWNSHDLLAKFEKLKDSEINQAIAKKIRAKHLRRVLD